MKRKLNETEEERRNIKPKIFYLKITRQKSNKIRRATVRNENGEMVVN